MYLLYFQYEGFIYLQEAQVFFNTALNCIKQYSIKQNNIDQSFIRRGPDQK